MPHLIKSLLTISGWLCLSATFLGFGALFALAPAAAQPRSDIPVTVHDFGQVREDQDLSHTFVVRNMGDKNLRILEVDPDCACTVVDYDRVIPPGGEGKVNLGIKPFSVVHQFEKKTLVRFNDPSRGSMHFILKGAAQRIIEIKPGHVVRFRGNPAENLTARVQFISNLPFPWEITRFENSIPDKVDVTLKTEKPGKIYIVEVKNKYREQGHYVGKIELFTNAIKKPKIVMRVIADLYPESAVSP